jgi:O-antigen ligase
MNSYLIKNKYFSLLVVLSAILYPIDQLLTAFGFPIYGLNTIILSFLLILLLMCSALISKKVFLNDVDIYKNLSYFGFLVFALIAIISVTWASNVEQSIVSFFQFAFLFIIYSIFVKVRLIEESILFFRLMPIVVSVCCFFVYVSYPEFFSSSESASQRLGFQSISVNSIATIWSIGFIVAIFNLKLEKNIAMKLFYFLLCIVIFFFIMRTGTRSTFIGVPISLVVACLLIYRNNFIKIIPFLLGLSIVFVLAFYFSINFLDERIIERLFFDFNDMSSNSRFELWTVGFNWYSNNLLGSGFGSESIAMDGLQTESHNTFISVMIQTSIIGLIFFCIGYFSFGLSIILSKDYKSDVIRLLVLTLFIFFSIQLMKGTLHTSRMFWFVMAYMAVVLNSKKYSS